MTLLPSEYTLADEGHTIQALRDHAMRAPWEWQVLFRELADRLEDSGEVAEENDARVGNMVEAGEKLTAAVRTVIGEGISKEQADALEAACAAFESATET